MLEGTRQGVTPVDGVDIPTLFNSQGRAVAMDGRVLAALRAENPATQFQLADGFTTSIIQGQQSPIDGMVRRIFSPIPVDDIEFTYPVFGTEHLQRFETLRGEREPYRHSEFTVTKATGKLARHSWAAIADVRELRNAHPSLGLSTKKAGFARRIVELSKEYEAADLLTTPGNYAATLAITGGNEWDTANGDPVGDVETAVNAITTATSYQPSDCVVILSLQSWRAARLNPTWRAERANVLGASDPSLAEFSSYLGVKRVEVVNVVGIDAGATSVAPLYSDIAIVFVEPQLNQYDTEYGHEQFSVEFQINAGVASPPYFENAISSWVWPFDSEYDLEMVNNAAGYLITNTHS